MRRDWRYHRLLVEPTQRALREPAAIGQGFAIRVSVIIPLYNKAPWIRRSVDSVLSQSFRNFELIVVDDGSTDQSALKLASCNDQRLRLLTQENLGPGAARNKGIAEARGELLAFLDADDEWLPDYLKVSVDLLDKMGGSVAAISSGYFEHPPGVSRRPMWEARRITEARFRLSPSTPPIEAVHRLAYMSPCTTVVRAGTLRKYGGFYSQDKCVYGEDAALWLKVLLNENIFFHMEPLVVFHTDASQLTKNLKGPRALEPFLSCPEEVHSASPRHLKEVLSQVLAIRALKSACVLGYWGKWREAKELKRRFWVPGYWRLPYYVPASILSNRLGAQLGVICRAVTELRTS
jgi:glycosyltransferase involved in cell wall biosynthesis